MVNLGKGVYNHLLVMSISSEMPTYPSNVCQFTGSSQMHTEYYPPGSVVDSAVLQSFSVMGIRQEGSPKREARCSGWCGRTLVMTTVMRACTEPSGIPYEVVQDYTYKNGCSAEEKRIQRELDANS